VLFIYKKIIRKTASHPEGKRKLIWDWRIFIYGDWFGCDLNEFPKVSCVEVQPPPHCEVLRRWKLILKVEFRSGTSGGD
jgi:hypothetical protein